MSDEIYVDKDDLEHCSICGEPVEDYYPSNEFGRKKHPRNCKCRRDEIQKYEDHLNMIEYKVHRMRCFSCEKYYGFTFANDNGKNPKMSVVRSYVENWSEEKSSGMGLLIWGASGVGKTFMAACVANALLDKNVTVRMTRLATIQSELMNCEDWEAYIRALCSYDLLILDDLGAERDSAAQNSTLFRVVDARIMSGRPLFVTTNLKLDDMKNCEDINSKRIFDRILSMCVPVFANGENQRKMQSKMMIEKAREQFGD